MQPTVFVALFTLLLQYLPLLPPPPVVHVLSGAKCCSVTLLFTVYHFVNNLLKALSYSVISSRRLCHIDAIVKKGPYPFSFFTDVPQIWGPTN